MSSYKFLLPTTGCFYKTLYCRQKNLLLLFFDRKAVIYNMIREEGNRRKKIKRERENRKEIPADLVICGLFICKFAHMRLRMILIYRTYPLIYSHPWSFYMRIRYMQVIFYGPHLSHITRSACTQIERQRERERNRVR